MKNEVVAVIPIRIGSTWIKHLLLL